MPTTVTENLNFKTITREFKTACCHMMPPRHNVCSALARPACRADESMLARNNGQTTGRTAGRVEK